MSIKALAAASLAVPLISVLGTLPAQAATVTQQYSAQISGYSDPGWGVAIDDTIHFSVTYDNSSLEYHTYDNGPNGLDDGGAGDDILVGTVTSPTGSTYSDASYDLSSIVSLVPETPDSWLDTTNSSQSFLYQFTVGDNIDSIMGVSSDGYMFQARDTSSGGTGYFRFANSSTNNWETLYLGSVTAEVSPVPIPAAAWLFGSGLLGLIGLAKRKQGTSTA